MAVALWSERLSFRNAAHSFGAGFGALAAGLRERGESSAGALGAAPARTGDPPVDGGQPLEAGASIDGGKWDDRDGRRRARAVVDYVDGPRNACVSANHESSSHHEWQRGPNGAARDHHDFASHGCGVRRFAGASRFQPFSDVGPEGRSTQHLGRDPQVAPGRRTGRRTDCAIAAATSLCRIVRPQPPERTELQSGVRSQPCVSGVL